MGHAAMRANGPTTYQPSRRPRLGPRSRPRAESPTHPHRNPSQARTGAQAPDEWAWSSYCHYASGERLTVEIESEWTAAR
jgi:hypothetical protein